ncbi:MAG TPA: phosphoribosylglycinamide formyltransferase [Candidatus Thalassarchaeaceae archaeon]|nr:phosphoribosylglycinamide formyltransferase [Euryarchaeota archaeon]DAC42333.1 MAG TPA: phosphoribosylglycinamide formyltransferase [Candidatus Poseidoniales archaeon]HII35436.1 phosphoribosylglycinamide formyltransferase [Candidatus Thalassarchaeaceae archaeon]
MISGGGSGLRALLKYQDGGTRLHATSLVIADSESAGGLRHAMDYGVDFVTIPLPKDLKGDERRSAHEEQILNIIDSKDIELVVLSGYMRILTSSFVSRWKGRLVNIHPSMLPDFPGAHAQRDALEAGVRVSGCTVHFVDEGVDSGPIIEQREVPVLDSDTVKTLSERIKEVEHELYPKVLDDISSGRVSP